MAIALEEADTHRHVSPLLATAIFGLLIVFYWFLLRRGYANSTRRVALTWTIVSLLPRLIVLALGASR